MDYEHLLLKRLSETDLGINGSHQAGFHVPKDVVPFFPPLDESKLNPDVWMEVTGMDTGVRECWRYVYYNNGVVSDGTRNEHRVTHCAGYLKTVQAAPGDDLELRLSPSRLTLGVRISRPKPEVSDGVLRLDRAGAWRSVRL